MSKYYAKGAVRSIKNFSKGYSDIQAKVRAATSNDPWGPSGTAMNEIAQATYDHHCFIEIMEMIDKRLNDKGKNWRHVFKALILLDYCLHVGSDNVVLYAKDNLYIVKTLREFIYEDEHGKDQGANVRQRAKEITNLLQDDERLKTERRQRATMRDRISGRAELPVPHGQFDQGIPNFDHPGYPAGYYDDDAELEKAIEESKKSQKEYERKQKELTQEEEDLAKALQLSEEEERKKEEKRKEEEAVRQNETPLIQGDTTSFSPISFQQQTDFFNPLNQQYTGPQFGQFGATVGQQPLNVISLDNQQSLNALGSQVFSTNPYQQQLLQLQQQQTNPYQQQILLQQQTQSTAKIGSNNPFGPLSQQQSPQQQNLSTTNVSTGNLINFGNEPSSQGSLLSFGSDPLQLQTQISTSAFGTPGISGQTSVSSQTPFDSSFGNIQNSNLGLQSSLMSDNLLLQNQQKTSNPQDEKYAQLNNLLANRGDGMDTFGNVGDLRVPTGTGYFNPSSNQTSKNPFQVQQQSTSPSFGDANKQASLNDLLLQQSQQGPNPYTQQTSNNVFGVYNPSPNNNSLF